MRSVLMGGRQPHRVKSTGMWVLVVWGPVMIMLAVIARESTSMFGAANTSAWLRAGYQALFGAVSDGDWPEIHHHIRKTGHFVGYGLLGLSWLRAWMLMWLGPLRLRAIEVWRGYSIAMALFCTMLVASLDELHQSYLPNRTGVPQDVLLDTSGAIVLILLTTTLWLRRERSQV